MPRPSLTRPQRAQNVKTAVADLPAAYARAMKSDSARDWEIVENLSATAHRQSRILAGKSRGG